MSATANKIRKMAKQAADEKIAAEREKIETNVSSDLEVIEKILSMVKDRLIYKEVNPPHSRRRYEVVTEEIVLHDYTTRDEKSYSYGTAIEKVESSFYTVPHTRIKVNGNVYYHAMDIFEKWKWETRKAAEKAKQEYDLANERKRHVKEMEALEPVVKELMLNYQKHELDKRVGD